MKNYQKTTARLTVKFVKKSNNSVILTLPTDSMEVYQYFSTDFINQIMRNTFKNIESIGDIMIVVDQDFKLK
jgi:hypothetical protein